MPGIWAQADAGWQEMRPVGFAQERELHDLIEQTPEMLPLAGSPTLAMLGREVACGKWPADLVAAELSPARPVVIEVKKKDNTERRHALTQVLSYAAFIRRLDYEGFERLLAPHP